MPYFTVYIHDDDEHKDDKTTLKWSAEHRNQEKSLFFVYQFIKSS